MSSNENWKVMQNVPAIRSLVFSEEQFEEDDLSVFIDGEMISNSMQRIELNHVRFNGSWGGLYSVSYDPTAFSEGIHELRIDLAKSGNVLTSESIQFSLDGQTTTLGSWIGAVTLEVSRYQLCQAIVSFFYAYTAIVLLILPKSFTVLLRILGLYKRFKRYLIKYLAKAFDLYIGKDEGTVSETSSEGGGKTVPKAIQVLCVDPLVGCGMIMLDLIHSWALHVVQYGSMHPFLWVIHAIIALYILVGPITVGPIVDDVQGFLFFVGVVINNRLSFIPETICYYGFFVVILIWMPSVVVSSLPNGARVIVDRVRLCQGTIRKESRAKRLVRTVYRFTLVGWMATLCSFVAAVLMIVFLAWQYGVIGVLSSILIFWLCIFAIFNAAIALFRVWRLKASPVYAV